MNDKDRSYNPKGEVEGRFTDWRMGPISEEAEDMIDLVERGPLGSGETEGKHLPDIELEDRCEQNF